MNTSKDCPQEITQYGPRAAKATSFLCCLIEALRTYEPMVQQRNDDGSFTQVILLENGDIIVRHNGDQDAFLCDCAANHKPHLEWSGASMIITGGCCSGRAALNS